MRNRRESKHNAVQAGIAANASEYPAPEQALPNKVANAPASAARRDSLSKCSAKRQSAKTWNHSPRLAARVAELFTESKTVRSPAVKLSTRPESVVTFVDTLAQLRHWKKSIPSPKARSRRTEGADSMTTSFCPMPNGIEVQNLL